MASVDPREEISYEKHMVKTEGNSIGFKLVYAGLIVMIIATGLAMIFKLGYDPAPALIMKPSKFSQPEEIGAVTYRRFYVPIEQAKRVVIGVPPAPEWHQGVIRGFLKEAATLGYPFDLILAEEQMPALNLDGLPSIEVQNVSMKTQSLADFGDKLAKAHAEGKRVLVYTVSIFSSHLLAGNPIDRYEKATGERLFSITTAPLALSAPEEHVVDPPCVGYERDSKGTAPLGCEILKASRGFYRKKIKADQYVAIMNSPRLDDYLLMIAPPQTSAAAVQ